MPRFPDPNAVVRPTTAPPRFRPLMTTRSISRLYPLHDHVAFVNRDGEGTTDVVASHFHRIKNWKVYGDQSDSHEHALTRLPAGAG